MTFSLPDNYQNRISKKHEISDKAKGFASFPEVKESDQDSLDDFKKEMINGVIKEKSNEELLDQLDGIEDHPKTVAQVLALQILLYRLGFNRADNIDGIYANAGQKGIRDPGEIRTNGSKTQKAVLAFQEEFGLNQDGQFGAKSLAKMKEVIKEAEGQGEEGKDDDDAPNSKPLKSDENQDNLKNLQKEVWDLKIKHTEKTEEAMHLGLRMGFAQEYADLVAKGLKDDENKDGFVDILLPWAQEDLSSAEVCKKTRDEINNEISALTQVMEAWKKESPKYKENFPLAVECNRLLPRANELGIKDDYSSPILDDLEEDRANFSLLVGRWPIEHKDMMNKFYEGQFISHEKVLSAVIEEVEAAIKEYNALKEKCNGLVEEVKKMGLSDQYIEKIKEEIKKDEKSSWGFSTLDGWDIDLGVTAGIIKANKKELENNIKLLEEIIKRQEANKKGIEKTGEAGPDFDKLAEELSKMTFTAVSDGDAKEGASDEASRANALLQDAEIKVQDKMIRTMLQVLEITTGGDNSVYRAGLYGIRMTAEYPKEENKPGYFKVQCTGAPSSSVNSPEYIWEKNLRNLWEEYKKQKEKSK